MNCGLSIAVGEIIEDAVGRLVRDFTPTQIILFGSCATGHGTVDSDIDLLIVMPDGIDRRQAAIQMHRQLCDLPMPKDIIVTTPEEIASRGQVTGSVLASALREGKILYERS